ncbi:hypothetical protein QTP88_002154 [Uroleucon formosanum]
MIDTIHNAGLRLVTGAYRSSPIPSLLNTAGVAPLDIRRVHSSILLATRRTQNNLKVMNQINDTLKDIPFSHRDVIKNETIQAPPWLLNIPINRELSKYSKNDTAPIIYKQHLRSIISGSHDFTEIYTDGSKMENGVGAAVVVQDHVSMLRLPNFCSIYTAEAIAISFALDLIKTNHIHKAVILSDSLSTLRSIENIYNPNEISRKIQNQIYNLTHTGYSITLLWIPSHNQIQGNERADQKARQAITSTDAIRLNHFTLHDAKSITSIITNNIWLRAWKQGTSKLNEIKNTIHTWPSPPDFSRKMETSVNRIRIGHTSITHQYLMKKEDPPICDTCADPSFDTRQKIDMLLGIEIFFDLISTGQLRPILHGPIFKNTTLGWIVSGSVSNTEYKTHTASVSMVSLCNLEEQIARFWQLEEVKNDSVLSLEEKLCKKYFYHNVRRDVDGRYVVSLPFSDVSKLGKSYNTALRYMELVPPVKVVDDNSCYYIPHHAVHKESSLTTKLRVVFDASCKTNTGISLNDVLLKEPCIQEDLVCIMARFRTYKFVLSADIAKMYRQIWLSVPNKDFQSILWRAKPDLPIQTFRSKMVTYGVVTSSYLATACLLKLSKENCSEFLEACRALRQDFYMDDLLTGANTIENALKIRDELVEILSKAGFELRQWNANETALLKNTNTSTSSTGNITKHEKITKILGVYWNNKNDSY